MDNVNKTLTIIAAVVLFIAIVNIGYFYSNKFTGRATDTGQANLTIVAQASLSFIINTTDWGAGAVDGGQTVAYLDSRSGTVVNGNWTAVTVPLTIQNDGNANVSLNITTDKDAATFIGGTAPAYSIAIGDNETGTCDATNNSLATMTTATTVEQEGCKEMGFQSTMDALNISVNLSIPSDATPGLKSSIITATATALDHTY